MTITFRHLVGTAEPQDKTIAYQLTQNWGAVTPTPTIEAQSTQPDLDAQNDFTGPNKILLNVVYRRKVPTADAQEPNGDWIHEWTTGITIEIRAEDISTLEKYENEVNRILWTISPNNSVRVNKSDATSSEIFMFEENELEFERDEPPKGKPNDNPSSIAILVTHWFKDKD